MNNNILFICVLLLLSGCVSHTRQLHRFFPQPVSAECEALIKHVQQYWHYDKQKDLYVYDMPPYKRDSLEQFQDCFFSLDSTQIVKLLGKPSNIEREDKIYFSYYLNDSCKNKRRNKCEMYMIILSNKYTKTIYGMMNWIE